VRHSALDDELKLAFPELDSITMLQRGGEDLSAVDENVVRTGEVSDPKSLAVEFECGVFGRNGSIVDLDLHFG
jgi:hypothetical protein